MALSNIKTTPALCKDFWHTKLEKGDKYMDRFTTLGKKKDRKKGHILFMR